MQPHAYLLDALLVLNEQLNTWNVDVEPGPLRGALHWSVDAAIVLAAHTHTHMDTVTINHIGVSSKSFPNGEAK